MRRRRLKNPQSARSPRNLGGCIPLASLIQTLAVAEHLSFHRAAKALGVSQPSVSARIRTLEENLGVRLFERSTRGVRLTEAGRVFVERVSVGVDQLDYAVRTAGMAASGECGRLRTGIHALIPRSFLAELIAQYREAHPGIEVEITEGTAREAVMQLLVVRGDDGTVRVLSDPCSHRSMPLAEGSGSTRRFVCSYHAWSYGRAGELVNAPSMRDKGVTRETCSLPSFPCEVWNGFVYANLDPYTPTGPSRQSMSDANLTFHCANCPETAESRGMGRRALPRKSAATRRCSACSRRISSAGRRSCWPPSRSSLWRPCDGPCPPRRPTRAGRAGGQDRALPRSQSRRSREAGKDVADPLVPPRAFRSGGAARLRGHDPELLPLIRPADCSGKQVVACGRLVPRLPEPLQIPPGRGCAPGEIHGDQQCLS
ncbi:LysR family transcriptional regulator [Paracoccus versutus]|uniref:LysR substrate binding domain-containing protein n=1 Tax=Paracoccus versutus TaxID=34007 RepID=A0AAQ0HI29_PARVE|nr:LysR family transcriptional regulator [Paracoccus versutus]REG46463.1 LysR substrate binding domain-containing protein [Paracoccus versutus]WEJ78504.1 LysR family transcriptional regulator [Paracoccus versutus]